MILAALGQLLRFLEIKCRVEPFFCFTDVTMSAEVVGQSYTYVLGVVHGCEDFITQLVELGLLFAS